MMKKGFLFFFVVLGAIQGSSAESLFPQYKLPPLEKIPQTAPEYEWIKQAKVLNRLDGLPLGFNVLEDPDAYQTKLEQNLSNAISHWPDGPIYDFSGSLASELNRVSQGVQGIIRLNNAHLTADEPIVLRSGLFIEGRNALITPESEPPGPKALISDRETKNAGVRGVRLDGFNTAIELSGAKNIRLENILIRNSGLGVAMINGSQAILLRNSNMQALRGAGILLQGDIHTIHITGNTISNGLSADNGAAAIVLSDATRVSNGKEPLRESVSDHALAQPIQSTAPAPHSVLIESNRLENNRSQGLYLDGAYGTVIRDNTLINNDKEGLCLDFGAALNIVRNNSIRSNGFRRHQSDAELKRDLVLEFRRLTDDSAVSKLPGISLDNAALNIIMENTISGNAGDGIKLVRSSYRNLILFNAIIDNNKGHNSKFHFFGVLVGSAGAEAEVDTTSPSSLDFLPSCENIIGGNLIYGQHQAAVLLDHETAYNDVYDNMARHFRGQAGDIVSTRPNSIIGNSWTHKMPETPKKKEKAAKWWEFWD